MFLVWNEMHLSDDVLKYVQSLVFVISFLSYVKSIPFSYKLNCDK